MSELKAFVARKIDDGTRDPVPCVEVYIKSEADKVIAEKDAEIVSLNREIAKIHDKMCEDVFEGIMPSEHIVCLPLQQAAEYIAELRAQKAQAEDDCAYWKMCHRNAENAMHETEEACMYLTKSERHSNYKRCLAMAYIEWLKQMSLCYNPESILYRRAYRRERKWKELAKKFKEAK